jgi:hypothetical protein
LTLAGDGGLGRWDSRAQLSGCLSLPVPKRIHQFSLRVVLQQTDVLDQVGTMGSECGSRTRLRVTACWADYGLPDAGRPIWK